MKAGTHLMQELMVALGYGIYGQTRITPDIRPVLDESTRSTATSSKNGCETVNRRIIFNYRDPRDVALSMVNLLAGRTARGYGDFNEFPVFNRIPEAKGTLEEQLSYALTDPSFPGYRAYENALWLLNHPNVCKVSFEELVGSQGGGSAAAQRAAVRRVVEFLGLGADPDEAATRLCRWDAFCFFTGQIGSWHEVFTPKHVELFDKRSGDLLALDGYLRLQESA